MRITENRAVFLDRDGVINSYFRDPEFGSVDSPTCPDQFSFEPGAPEAIASLHALGFRIIVVSNQPGIAKRKFTRELLDATTAKMVTACNGQIDAVYYCLHHPQALDPEYHANCECRKPGPGLLHRAAAEWNIDLSKSYMVGDGIVDVLAGRSAGTRTIFVGQSKPYIYREFERERVMPDYFSASLATAAELIHSLESNTLAQEPKTSRMSYSQEYIHEAASILNGLDDSVIERMADLLRSVREQQGRVFFLGVGGGAGHASHAVCDFRKIAGIECYTPSDNVSELTARTNDEGWESVYSNWLRTSRLGPRDAVFVFSVGGGDLQRNVSANLVRAVQYAQEVQAKVCGVVGRDGGYTAKVADECVIVRCPNPSTTTPHTEAFQAFVWHLLVSHPKLKAAEMKWESMR